jgi:hypothetical protein
LRKELIARGKKFVSLAGVHHKAHKGLAFYRKKKSAIKVNVNSRVMIDAATHRRINPNYMASLMRARPDDSASDEDRACDEDDSLDSSHSDEETDLVRLLHALHTRKGEGGLRINSFEGDIVADTQKQECGLKNGDKTQEASSWVFTDDQYLLASPLVLGFAFSEKLWLEFTISGIKDVLWNETAYDALVLAPETKNIVRVRLGGARNILPGPRCKNTNYAVHFLS